MGLKEIILNFGHTIGHALELKFGFNKLRHGEAVAFGMLCAGYVSFKLKKLDEIIADMEELRN